MPIFKKSTDEPFFIAEVGQNHNGNLELALEFIKVFAHEGADAIKFQTRNNKILFDKEAYDAPYVSENAYAKTYGEHREKLEIKPDWLPLLKDECDACGVKFMSTPFDEPSLELLTQNSVQILKVASFDIGNLPFLNRIGETKVPVVMSVGGGKAEQIRLSVETICRHHQDIAILHCVSEYPCEYNRLGLNNIGILEELYPNLVIGSSDHFNGILSGPIAYLKGARVFEKHVTLNRAWRGTDHSFALEREGFRKFVRDVKRVRYMLEPKPDADLGNEKVFSKLGKSISALVDIKAGEKITLDNISGRIFKTQFVPVRDSHKFLGKHVSRDIKRGGQILHEDLQDSE
ncbi:N-acetylneuraminate synthase family protein [Alphaproteobacteria bacterium]|nr:N-acetylneuraminate synthase family protein [Alphaproteobacteria bacterium]